MKTIQWYPGHMAKAMRMMAENLNLADAAVFVLDARAPASAFNRKLRDLVGEKPVLYVLNKGDLADGGADSLLAAMKKSGLSAVKIAANSSSAARTLTAAMEALVAEKRERMAQKGLVKPVRFFIAGVPNTGKSTVINLLCGGKKTVTGDKAGVTRAKQWVRCGAFELMDTPGTMPPSFENQTLALRLAYLGCVNDDILDIDDVALALLEELAQKYPQALFARYGIEQPMTPIEMLNAVCVRRGFVLRGNDFDYERGERTVIDDFRKGRLGKVCLDRLSDLKDAGLI